MFNRKALDRAAQPLGRQRVIVYPMTIKGDDGTEMTPAEKLARLVAQRKAALATAGAGRVPGQRASERQAGALAESKSKPAPRK